MSTDGVEPLYFITADDLTYQAKCPILGTQKTINNTNELDKNQKNDDFNQSSVGNQNNNNKKLKNDKSFDKEYNGLKFQQNGVKTELYTQSLKKNLTYKPTKKISIITQNSNIDLATQIYEKLTTKINLTKSTNAPKKRNDLLFSNISKKSEIVEANVIVSSNELEKTTSTQSSTTSNFIRALKANSLTSIETLKAKQNTNHFGLEAITNSAELKFRDNTFPKFLTTPQLYLNIQTTNLKNFNNGVGTVHEINIDKMHKQKDMLFATTPIYNYKKTKVSSPNSNLRFFNYSFFFKYYH